ncbi:hypothetical protein [Vibrio crassostreae]|uniref:hypothetical protein n=1 Tax=Vibrio crassostreae TaxID=246167 RepID=UPI0006392737|nr:hypothetical protein [Vibrio crassostreae]TCO03160.1 hypothetical protein EDB30_105140 [Vibrio crassostreae]CAK1735035.1 conserved hypothetical protein [Vibrio crassostreae]CAK1735917.1 conserved hypothetical protein [Vibrio crassostreae]CAK1735956.1 conserved hypothetical protein [Vibrio crassostreae]CAK2136745.1 conserved hypothetical protein [Vibrio crassostreae]
MNNYIWREFGILKSVNATDSTLYITSNCGKTLKMSLRKYKQQGLLVKKKAEAMLGSQVVVRTSQNTAQWSTSEWFSELRISSEKATEPKKSNRNEQCLSCEGKGFYLFCGGTRKQTCSNCGGLGIRAESKALNSKANDWFSSPKAESEPTQSNVQLKDYSRSYVEGDLGHINTKFWNGY